MQSSVCRSGIIVLFLVLLSIKRAVHLRCTSYLIALVTSVSPLSHLDLPEY